MWGWKSVERLIEPAISLSEAKRILAEAGFQLQSSQPHHAIFKSEAAENPWTTMAPDGANIPIELAVGTAHQGLYLHLRYATLVLFDTGDLNRFADEIVAILTPHANCH